MSVIVPSFRLSRYTGVLQQDCIFQSPIRGFFYASDFVELTETQLILREGYQWDFGTGPVVNTPAVVYASLAHDAMFDFIDDGVIPESERKLVDLWFRDLLAEAGMSWFRRNYIYWGVRLLHPLWKKIH